MPDSFSLFIDIDRCWGCRTCEVACSIEKKMGPGRSCVRVEKVDSGKNSPVPGSLQGKAFVPVLCQQCSDPACVSACPVGALRRGDSGLVEFDEALCIACGVCESACPYGAISLSGETGMPEKCDQCISRLRSGLLPACVQHCPGHAITVGRPKAEASRGEKKEISVGKIVYLSRG